MLKRWQEKRRRRDIAAQLYDRLVEQARCPAFYAVWGVPDTMLGRYEMVCLHAFLVFRRLGRAGAEGRALAQEVHDRMFADFDRTLREVGIGDMGIGKRIKKLARNLYGRIAAYEDGLAQGDAALADALRRNVFAGAEAADSSLAALIAYLKGTGEALARQEDASLLAGTVTFPEPAAALSPAGETVP